MQFEPFDDSYLERLRAGDFRTQQHFAEYFGALIQIKLRSRLRSPQAIEDVQQETFLRVLTAVKEGKIRQPDRLGAYVNSMCNNVLFEQFRKDDPRDIPIDDDMDWPTPFVDPLLGLSRQEQARKIDAVLKQLPKRDREILCAVYYENRDKDEVCAGYGITRDNLRLILCRALKKFKSFYLKGNGDPPSEYNTT